MERAQVSIHPKKITQRHSYPAFKHISLKNAPRSEYARPHCAYPSVDRSLAGRMFFLFFNWAVKAGTLRPDDFPKRQLSRLHTLSFTNGHWYLEIGRLARQLAASFVPHQSAQVVEECVSGWKKGGRQMKKGKRQCTPSELPRNPRADRRCVPLISTSWRPRS